jgi:hypothetical protein
MDPRPLHFICDFIREVRRADLHKCPGLAGEPPERNAVWKGP